ncbi:unannotated protein [freshwater metagenome]|uniref:Unannotated protein n=1 Tax=freshwater metagenome TaxID=449393 RepID=A0A6J6DI04_9ZZZZ
MAFLSMQGSWTKPPTGSQVRPRLCSIAISAAFSICSLVPPSTAVIPAAAIEQADPTSPWQPASAPEIDAFNLYSAPIAPAVSKYSRAIFSSLIPRNWLAKYATAGMMPAAPLVGAVTTLMPAAFSSLTAIAKACSHSAVRSPTLFSLFDISASRSVMPRARLGTFRYPGKTPSLLSPD